MLGITWRRCRSDRRRDDSHGNVALVGFKSGQMAFSSHFLKRIGLLIVLMAGEISAHDASEVAIARETAGIKSQPEDAARYLARALLHLEHGNWLACLVDVDRADSHTIDDLGFDLLRGRAFAFGKRWPQARTAIDAHLKSHPLDAAAWIALARTEDALGRADSAARDYALAMQLMKNSEPDHFVECSDLLCRAGHDEEALSLLDQAPVLPVIVDRAVGIELRLGHVEAALRRLDALLAISRMQEPLMAKRASILAQAGRSDEAIQVWKTLVQRIDAMAPQARGSHAMSKLRLQSQQALISLNHTVISESP